MQRWLAFQLLEAVAQAHEAGVYHGDVTCENVLVTSWNWAFLTDFASYKPTRLPADNPVSLPHIRLDRRCLSGSAALPYALISDLCQLCHSFHRIKVDECSPAPFVQSRGP